jgi:hypothetical protein
MYRNGAPQRVAYLGELRVDPDAARSPALLRDGYDFLVRHAEPADGFFTSIASENVRARRVLERGSRLGLPDYQAICELATLVIPVGHGVIGRETVELDARSLTEFLDCQSRQHQLALTWNDSRWMELARHGVSPASFAVIHERSEIAGTAGIWDQRPFRQVVVDGYEGSVGLARPLYNGVQSLRRMATLPPPGSVLAQGMLLGAFVREPGVWDALWPVLAGRARAIGLSWLTVSRQVDDPELAVVRRVAGGQEYRTTLYAVDWRHGPRWRDDWDTRSYRPEVALL